MKCRFQKKFNSPIYLLLNFTSINLEAENNELKGEGGRRRRRKTKTVEEEKEEKEETATEEENNNIINNINTSTVRGGGERMYQKRGKETDTRQGSRLSQASVSGSS